MMDKMQITVNGDAMQVPTPYTAEMLVAHMQLTQKRIAMEVNEDIVPRSTYADFQFQVGDKVEIVQAIGGG